MAMDGIGGVSDQVEHRMLLYSELMSAICRF